ncbi:hypothetical protein RFI_18768 [Reticulomyxa filosa]|uniref:SAM domain-containing protein n=1 Tax=Reticulomyxa filosa TaxID=46433 RepID=X6MYE6_RETFI|nr:hypothetical protein RFI_18768 [Reticulomyxa filosa]|eukprot:ETO18497.1 hypothetical protein RFI_18768 [Reticulomyxa filosa]
MQQVANEKLRKLPKHRKGRTASFVKQTLPENRYIYTPFKTVSPPDSTVATSVTLQNLRDELVLPEEEVFLSFLLLLLLLLLHIYYYYCCCTCIFVSNNTKKKKPYVFVYVQSNFEPIEKCQILKQGDQLIQIQLATDEIVYLCTKKVETWSTKDVTFWIGDIGEQACVGYASKFESEEVDGKKLKTLTKAILQNQFGIMDVHHRQFVMNEIINLRVQVDGEKRADAMGLRDSINHAPRSRSMGWAYNKQQRTPEQVEKDRQRRRQFRKLGPRDIGRNDDYTGIQYTPNLSYDFLQDKPFYTHSGDADFQKRKKEMPPEKKPTVQEIGKFSCNKDRERERKREGFFFLF